MDLQLSVGKKRTASRSETLPKRIALFFLCMLTIGMTIVCAAGSVPAEENVQEAEAQPGTAVQEADAQAGTAQGADSQAAAAQETDDGVYSVLLIGSDRREEGWYGNSDAMILISLQEETGRVSMISFMRDLGVDIPGYGTDKLNAAYAAGGSGLLEDTLKSNFDIDVDNYAAVDVYDLIDIIDSLGGIDMEVRDEEIDTLNMYIMSMCPYMGLNENDYLLYSGGYLHLNGMQAVAFCRIRFVGDNDYERTERQRRTLRAMLDSLRSCSPQQLIAFTTAMVTDVDTDVSLPTLLGIVPTLTGTSDFDLTTGRVPFDGLYGSSGEMLMPSQPDTNQRLRQMIYGE